MHSTMSRRSARIATTIAVAVAAFVATATAAAAHVTVSSPDAAPGEFGKLVFRVPTESDTASTSKLEVRLPAGTPFAFVSAKTKPGWSVGTTERKLDKPIKAEGFTLTKAVATVTWTAEDEHGIPPGEFDEFELSVGPFPSDVGPLALPVVQTYDDGTVVTWDQPTPASGEEPEHPVPTLTVAAADGAGGADAADGADTGTDPVSSAAAQSGDEGDDGTDGLARGVAVAGLVLGAAALVVALLTARGRGAR